MTILPTGVKERMRSIFAERMHNTVTSVKKISATTTDQLDPRYEETTQNTLTVYTDFGCSYYHMLSGKIDRMFAERDIAELTAQLGTLEQIMYVVRYVCDLTLSTTSPAGGPAVVNNLKLDEEVLIDGEWWKVRLVIEDSEGVQHTALLSK